MPYAIPNASTAPTPANYNMDWANTTLRSTRINAFVCPSDSNNNPAAFFYTKDDYVELPAIRPDGPEEQRPR